MALLKQVFEWYQSERPFVVYRKPSEHTLRAMLVVDDNLFQSDAYAESGFVLAPFDPKQAAVIFRESDCHFLEEVYIPNPSCSTSVEVEISEDTAAKHQHLHAVNQAINAIKSGKYQKLVISRSEQIPLKNNFVAIYKRLLSRYPTAMVYCWYHPRVGMWTGATPEKLFQTQGRQLVTMALAGTQAYQEGVEVVWGSKEKEEQQFVTDYILYQLRDLLESHDFEGPHTVRAGNLIHLKTDIRGRLTPDTGMQTIIQALHPTPAVAGVPKESSVNYILQNHPDRKFYTGFLGELNLQGTTDLYVNLRCMELTWNQATLYIGGGITADSVAELEWHETVMKSMVMKKVLF